MLRNGFDRQMGRALILLIALSLIFQLRIAYATDEQGRLLRLENFLLAQFNATVGLVRESPDSSISIDYWLLSDNLVAMHVLRQNHSDIAAKINLTLQRYGIFTDGLHEALFGSVIQLPPYTPTTAVVENDSFAVEVEQRSNATGKLQNDWVNYADILIYAALSEHNAGNDQLALYYFNRAQDMWNEAGLYDRPTQLDGFYTTHKLALLMYAADMLNQILPFRNALEDRIWMFQREDGGIRSHYLGNLTSHREANSETASLVLLAYQYKAQKDAYDAARNAALTAEEAREHFLQQAAISSIAIAIAVAIVFIARSRRKKLRQVNPINQLKIHISRTQSVLIVIRFTGAQTSLLP